MIEKATCPALRKFETLTTLGQRPAVGLGLSHLPDNYIDNVNHMYIYMIYKLGISSQIISFVLYKSVSRGGPQSFGDIWMILYKSVA